MKKYILLAALAATFCGCGSDNPPPDHRPATHSGKAPPSVSSQKAEDFRAIEKPSTYSE